MSFLGPYGARGTFTTQPHENTDGNEKGYLVFSTPGGVAPLLAPEGVSTMIGHSRYPLLIVEILTREKVKCSEERLCLFMHSFTKNLGTECTWEHKALKF